MTTTRVYTGDSSPSHGEPQKSFFRRWLLVLLLFLGTSVLLFVAMVVLLFANREKDQDLLQFLIFYGYIILQMGLAAFCSGYYTKRFFSTGLALKAAGSIPGFLGSLVMGFCLSLTCLAFLGLSLLTTVGAAAVMMDPSSLEDRSGDFDDDLFDLFD